ncbi:MAG: LptF/LptG family permease [Endomicrobiales bacterium]|nr:LptF/LptG family permease [Endomicrobiales bacterium]
MKIIQRYIIKEFIVSFIFGLVVFSGILLLDQIFQLVDLLLGKGVSFWIVLNLFLLALPNILTLTIPMATLFGILLAYGRLSEDNEITALRSAGTSYFNFTLPIVFIVIFFSLFLVYFNQNLAPKTHKGFRNIFKTILKTRPITKFEEKSIINLNEYRIYVEKIDKKTNLLKGVNIYKFSDKPDDPSSTSWRISASSAVVYVNSDFIVFDLYRGYWQKPNPAMPENLIHLKFFQYKFNIPLGTNKIPMSQSLKEMNGDELRREILKYRQKKLPTNFLEVEYWIRWILATAPFFFALVGVPLGIVLEKGKKSISFGISLLILFTYYLLLVTGLNIGEKGYVSPRLILWMPNMITFILGIFLWRKMLKK